MKWTFFFWLLVLFFALMPKHAFPQEMPSILNNSGIAFTIPEKDLLPESIAYDAVSQSFYIGSTRKGKIVKLAKDGTISDFVSAQQHGLWMIIGMEIDAKRRHLWICSSGGGNLQGYKLKDEVQGRPAGIFKFDLDSGQLIKKYTLENFGEVHFLNDLVISTQGDVYITHMFGDHSIYKISKHKDQLERFCSSELLQYPNGLAFSKTEASLYIAHAGGIALLDLSNKKIEALKIPENLKIARRESIDGLYFYDHSLIGIQPDINTVQQFILSADGKQIVDTKLLEVNHPMMNNPTTGEIIGDTFFYIANAQFGSFSEDGTLFPLENLYEVCILKTPIK